MQIYKYGRDKHTGAGIWHNQPIDQIGPLRPTARPSKSQSGVLQATEQFVAGSMTAQPPGSRPSAFRVAAHSQQVAPLREGGLNPF